MNEYFRLNIHLRSVAFYVYILRSRKNGRLYTGPTEDLERRFEEHNSGLSKATRYYRPFDLVHFEHFKTRQDAVQREMFLKTGRGRDEISKILQEDA